MFENPVVLVIVSLWASLLDYDLLWHSRLGRPAQLHNELSIPRFATDPISLLDARHSNNTSPPTNETMLVEHRATQPKTSPVT